MYPLLSSYNISGIHVIFVYLNDISGGLFMNLFLLSIWMVFTFSPYFAQVRRFGTGDFASCMAVGSFVTMVSTFLFRLVSGLVGDIALSVVIGIMLISLLALFFNGKE